MIIRETYWHRASFPFRPSILNFSKNIVMITQVLLWENIGIPLNLNAACDIQVTAITQLCSLLEKFSHYCLRYMRKQPLSIIPDIPINEISDLTRSRTARGYRCLDTITPLLNCPCTDLIMEVTGLPRRQPEGK